MKARCLQLSRSGNANYIRPICKNENYCLDILGDKPYLHNDHTQHKTAGEFTPLQECLEINVGKDIPRLSASLTYPPPSHGSRSTVKLGFLRATDISSYEETWTTIVRLLSRLRSTDQQWTSTPRPPHVKQSVDSDTA